MFEELAASNGQLNNTDLKTRLPSTGTESSANWISCWNRNEHLSYDFFEEVGSIATGENTYHVDVIGIGFLALWCDHPKANIPAHGCVSASGKGENKEDLHQRIILGLYA